MTYAPREEREVRCPLEYGMETFGGRGAVLVGDNHRDLEACFHCHFFCPAPDGRIT